MSKSLSVQEFLALEQPLFDVRSPAEFDEGHVTGALNFPLLNNQHRILIGTCYKQKGRDAAIKLGYELVNPLRNSFLERLKQVSDRKQIKLYCARGGLRSSNMASFLGENGYEVSVLKGGYKSYRNHILKVISSFKNIIILSGYTGSGKTEILNSLKAFNTQVLDLEGLAQHKGSAFGALGYQGQPNSSIFHNRIFDELCKFDSSLPLWVENESVTIGKVFLPKELWENMKIASGVEVELSIEERIKFTISQYGHFEAKELSTCIQNLSKRLGDEETRRLCNLLDEGDLEPIVRSLFRYYDKAYEFGRSKRNCHHYVKISCLELKPEQIAEYLLSHQNEYLL